MNAKQKKKIIGWCCVLLLLSSAIGLVLYALKQNINLFYTPTEVYNIQLEKDHALRLGGIVKANSVHYDQSGKNVTFTIADSSHEIIIHYKGVLPNLFREGQTIVTTGKLNSNNEFAADEVLAKHDEKYFPFVRK